MPSLPHAVPSLDLGVSVSINEMGQGIAKQVERLEAESERLRVLHARTYLGSQLPLWFLLQMEHECFPLKIADPVEIRYVSVLTATGLVQAEIEALEATKRYAVSRRAIVFGITNEGRAEIARIWGTPAPTATSMLRAKSLVLM